MRMSSAPLTLALLNVAACAGCFVVSRTNAATSSTVQARGSAGLSVASMSEPESSSLDTSESDEADRRLLDLSGALSESEPLRDLRFGEGEPCLPVSTSRAAVSLTALATWPVNASSKASPAVAGSVVASFNHAQIDMLMGEWCNPLAKLQHLSSLRLKRIDSPAAAVDGTGEAERAWINAQLEPLLQEQARVRSLEIGQQQRELRNERLGFILIAVGLVTVVAIVLWRLRDLRRYRALSTRDGLTGIANRRHIFDRLESLLEGLAPDRGSLSVVLLDVDDFKAINDRHGHPVGDRVLQALAASLAGMLRPGDEVARVGGEEFLLVLPRTDRDGAVRVAARLREALRDLRVAAGGGAPITITASIGVATAGPGRDNPAALYAAADEALYRAKASGKNRFELAAAVS